MRRMLRWLFVLGLIGAAVYAGVTYKVRGRTPYAHAKSWFDKTVVAPVIARWKEDPKAKKQPARAARTKLDAKPTAPAKVPEEEATAARVALLENAAKETTPKVESKPRTKVDRIQPRDKKALDDLVSSRVSPR